MLLFLVALILLFLVGKSLLSMTLSAVGFAVGIVLVLCALFIKRRNSK